MDQYVGQIILWPVSRIPKNWHLCDGTLLPISGNEALFSLLSTTYGGNGVTNFGLPDLRGRVPIGCSNTYPLAKIGGAESVNLTSGQLPAHTHTATVTTDIKNLTVTVNGTPYNNSPGPTNIPSDSTCLANATTSGSDDANIYNTSAPTAGKYMASPGVTTSGGVGVNVQVKPSGGNSAPVSVVQPYAVVNYIISLQGIYPTRS